MFRFLTDSRAHTRRARRPAVSQLEALENRTCLSATFTAIYVPATGTLAVAEVPATISSGSKVTISENAAHDTITVAGSGLGTVINSATSVSFNLALTPINNIAVTYNSASATVGNNANDTLMVEDVSLPNALTVTLASKAPTTPLGGNNTVDISNGHFFTATVADATAISTAKDHVTVNHDTGSFTVTEANGYADGIHVMNSPQIGPSTFTQGNGLSDRVRVNDVTSVGGMNIFQNLTGPPNGGGDLLFMDNVYATGAFNYNALFGLPVGGGSQSNYTELENVVSNGGLVNGGAGGSNVLAKDASFGFIPANYTVIID